MARPRFQNLPPERRREILDVAARHFAADGFAAASVNRILEDAGLSKGAAYYYFDDKADLFVTVVEEAWNEVAEAARFDVENTHWPEYWDEFERLYRLQFEQFAGRPHLWRTAKAAQEVLTDPSGERLLPRFEALMTTFVRILREGQEAGCVRSDLPMDLLWTMLGGLDGAIDTWFLDHPEALEREPELPARTFAVLRRLLEPPKGEGASRDPDGSREDR